MQDPNPQIVNDQNAESADDQNSKKSAVIVFRHAHDGGNTPEGPLYYSPTVDIETEGENVDSINVGRSWLDVDGKKRAQAFTYQLYHQILSKYCPVSRVITEDPGKESVGTPNPLLTVDPLVRYLSLNTESLPEEKLKLRLYKNKTYQENEEYFNPNALLKDGVDKYSTVICWEAFGMWRLENKEKDNYRKDQLLGMLARENEKPILSYDQNSPRKAQTLYVFTNLHDNKFDLIVYNFNGEIFKEVTGDYLP